MSFTITGWTYDTDDGLGEHRTIEWGDDVDGSIAEAMRRANDDPENRTATDEAAGWLSDYLSAHGPRVAAPTSARRQPRPGTATTRSSGRGGSSGSPSRTRDSHG